MRQLIQLVNIIILTVWLIQFHSPTVAYAQSSGTSQVVTWTCSGTPCPWGTTLSDQATVWPTALGPITNRLGYSTSAGVYLPAGAASGMAIAVTSGTATVYAGRPDDPSHHALAPLTAGQSYLVTGLDTDEVISLQGNQLFAYTLTMSPLVTPTATSIATVPPTATSPPTATATPMTTATATEASPTATHQGCDDPNTCDPVSSIAAFWRCNIPDCTYPDWIASVISWPSWSAHEDNARIGGQSRTVYSAEGEKLYPYMGAWADGCQITAVSGTVLIIEWQRGTDVWRETALLPGQTHTISLIPPENGALIETYDNAPLFSVSLANCTPQALSATATPMATATATEVSPTATPQGCDDPSTCDPVSGTSQVVTWTCSGTPCPWGTTLSDQAAVWPTALGPITNRLGYTTSAGVYLPASAASGMAIAVTAGTATVYAGQPDELSHHALATLTAGQSYLVTGLDTDEVISLQGNQLFAYTLTIGVSAAMSEKAESASNATIDDPINAGTILTTQVFLPLISTD